MTNGPFRMPDPSELTPEQHQQLQRYAYLRARIVNLLETERVPPDVGFSLCLDVGMWSAAHCPEGQEEGTLESALQLAEVLFQGHRQKIVEMMRGQAPPGPPGGPPPEAPSGGRS